MWSFLLVNLDEVHKNCARTTRITKWLSIRCVKGQKKKDFFSLTKVVHASSFIGAKVKTWIKSKAIQRKQSCLHEWHYQKPTIMPTKNKKRNLQQLTNIKCKNNQPCSMQRDKRKNEEFLEEKRWEKIIEISQPPLH